MKLGIILSLATLNELHLDVIVGLVEHVDDLFHGLRIRFVEQGLEGELDRVSRPHLEP